MGMNEEKGLKTDFLIRFRPSESLLLFDEKNIFPRHNFRANKLTNSLIRSIPMSNAAPPDPADIPTGNEFIVSPLSNRWFNSSYLFSCNIFWRVQTVRPPSPVLRLGSSCS